MRTFGRAALATTLALGALLGLAGCTQVDDVFTETTRPAATFATAVPRFSDSDPVDNWEGGGPHGFPVHGIDVSKYQQAIDWQKARSAGVAFAFIKATEGGDRLDDRFIINWHDAKRAGVPRSAYHFYYFCTPAAVQARWFIRNVPKDKGALPHVLDMEWNHKSPSCKFRPSPEKVRAEMETFMSMIASHYGRRPIIYTTVDFHRENLVGHFERDAFWLRSVKAHPRVPYPGRNWVFWQYTGTGRVPGINGDADINVFVGGIDQWRKWLASVTN